MNLTDREQYKKKFLDLLLNFLPNLEASHSILVEKLHPNLFCPLRVNLPRWVLEKASLVIKELFALRNQKTYQESLQQKALDLNLYNPKHFGLCMSYDFHFHEETQRLKLIEVNTNASCFGLGHWFYPLFGCPFPFENYSPEDFVKNVKTEFSLWENPSKKPLSVAIIDENPPTQLMYSEFLYFQELLKKFSIPCTIRSLTEDCTQESFFYNRYTDFYLNSSQGQSLRHLYNSKNFLFSPSPWEYLLLADKNRLLEWPKYQTKKTLFQEHLLESFFLTKETEDFLWANRKKFFFKPLQSFASKGAYKGENISKKAFASLLEIPAMAQEYCPPGTLFLEKEKTLKYDLRFFAYQERVQGIIARVYEGQTTNLKSPYGGFACVQFF